jgi:hypothetical protein
LRLRLYYGDLSKLDEDASAGNKLLDQWFNTGLPFERNAANLPTGPHVRVFSPYFNEIRADGLNQWNANVLRNFKITERFTLQNRSQMNAPDISPTSTNFGRVASQTSSLNRFYQVQARIQF